MDLFNNAASIGIIGGADGPTSIFITGDIQNLVLGALALCMLIATGIVLAMRKK